MFAGSGNRHTVQKLEEIKVQCPQQCIRCSLFCGQFAPSVIRLLSLTEDFVDALACCKFLVDLLRITLISKDFSKRLADSLLILSLIRLHPGIKTRELAKKTELSLRSVQRYISTLQATGEGIEYNTVKKGWELQNRISILLGGHLK